jgi:hypothetical protein
MIHITKLYVLHNLEPVRCLAISSAVHRRNTTRMKLIELAAAICSLGGGFCPTTIQELDDWTCTQTLILTPPQEYWGAIRNVFPTNFIVATNQNCSTMSAFLFQNGTLLDQHTLLPRGQGCQTNWTLDALTPATTLYDVALYMVTGNDTTSMLSRVPPYTRTAYTSTYRLTSSTTMVHTLTFSSAPIVTCCEGYTLTPSTGGSGICGMPTVFEYTKTYTTSYPGIPMGGNTVNATFTLPDIPCISDGMTLSIQGTVFPSGTISSNQASEPISSGTVPWIVLGAFFFGIVFIAFGLLLFKRQTQGEDDHRVRAEESRRLIQQRRPTPNPTGYEPFTPPPPGLGGPQTYSHVPSEQSMSAQGNQSFRQRIGYTT